MAHRGPGKSRLRYSTQPRASTNMEARNGVLPAGFTFSRASGATYTDYRGQLATAATDVLRYNYDPALPYNLAPNPWGDGSPPTAWEARAGTGIATPSFVSSGVRDGVFYTRWRVQGTSSGSALVLISPFASGSLIPAVVGDTFSGQVFVEVARLGAGSTWTGLSVRLRGQTSNSLVTSNNEQTSTGISDAVRFSDGPQRVSRTLTSGSTLFAEMVVALTNSPGVVFDMDIDIGFPVFNTGASYLTDTVPIATLAARVGTTPQYGLEGALVERIPATNLFLNSAVGVTQNVTTTAAQHTLSFTGTGSITLTGTSTAGPLVGAGANNRVSLVFTPSAGTLTLTIAGDVRRVQLETGFLSSYIVTTGAATTRAADILNIDPALIDLDQSSISIGFRVERGGVGVAAAAAQTVFSVQNTNNDNSVRVITLAAATAPVVRVAQAAALSNAATSAVGSGVFQSVAAGWAPTETAATFDGAAVTTTAARPDGSATDIFVGSSASGSSLGNNTIRFIRIWKGRRLSAAQLQREAARTA